MYTTTETVTLQLGQFSTMLLANLSDEDVDRILTETDNTIDGYLASAVTLPFTAVPKLITKIATDIAVRTMWAQKQAKDIPAHVKDDYDNALKLLTQIAKGSLKLTAADPLADSFFDLKYSVATRTFADSL